MPRLSRRALLATGAASAVMTASFRSARAAPIELTAAPGQAPIAGADKPETALWLYNGVSPGPVLRGRQGDTLRVRFVNGLEEPSSVHWHGLRVPVEMDGVPYFSQPAVAPGARFDYVLPLEDAGTFWYHPHVNSSEQVGRGLNGVLIVEEPPEVSAVLDADREVIWTLDDWRLDEAAALAPFGRFHDASHGGRIGNIITVNSSEAVAEPVRAGERLRLRLANVSNAMIFHPRFAGLDAWLVALDGHPIAPRALGDDGVLLGAGQRADVVVDMTMAPGEGVDVIDDAFGPDNRYRLMTFVASDEAAIERPRQAPGALTPNPVPRPDLATAERHALVFEGGAMGGLRGATMGGELLGMRELAQAGRLWAINGVVPDEITAAEPILRLALGTSHILRLENRTAFPHPIHVHGHSFFVLRDGEGQDCLSGAEVRDTVMLGRQETAEIAFVADNPGKWMVHCHVLEHQASGMMGVMEVG